MKPTATLVAEHQLILTGLKVLADVSRRLKERKRVDLKGLAKLLRFFVQFADKVHHTKEEQALVTRLESAHRPELNRLIDPLMTQHLLAREFVSAMMDAARDLNRKSRGAGMRFCLQADAYVTLMRIHICDEEHVLFPLAERNLTWHQSCALARKFMALDRELGTTKLTVSFARFVGTLDTKQPSHLKSDTGRPKVNPTAFRI